MARDRRARRPANGCFALAGLLLVLPAFGQDVLIADFEDEDYGDWVATGEAFGSGPAKGALPGQMHVSGYEGRSLVNTFFRGDGTVGTLASPALTIQRPFVCFLIGGGKYPGETCVNLLVDGRVARTATGPNDRQGGTERLRWACWDVREYMGKQAVIEIVDSARGGWGHINVDQIIQTEEAIVSEQTREMTFERRYLNLPVRNGAPKQRVSLTIDGTVVREFEIELAEGEPDFWVFLDLAPFQGKTGTLRLLDKPRDAAGLDAVTQDDEIRGAEDLYRERYRPQFHFTSRRGWNNDPNGLVYFDGEYHLFYQHNPYGWGWGNMHWGHAVSPDLVHWREVGIAIYPHNYGDWVFSGSAAIDWENTSGFGDGTVPPMIAAYTSTGRGEAIAYSLDRGRTFTDYQGNPVVKHSGRDPKIIRHRASGQWVMAVYDEQPVEGKDEPARSIAFYTSPNLKDWTLQSRLEGFYECPELFEIAVDGDPDNTRWVAYGASGEYAVGQFDGREFTVTDGRHRFNFGNCFYASQTFNDIPEEDGRRIQIAWGTLSTPGMPFNQLMMFPVELTLHSTAEGLRLFANPVREIEAIRARSHCFVDRDLREQNPLEEVSGDLFDIELVIDPGDAREIGLLIRGVPVAYDCAKSELHCRGVAGKLERQDGAITLRALVDRTTIELFGNGGALYMPIGVIPPDNQHGLAVYSIGGSARIHSLVVHELCSIWA